MSDKSLGITNIMVLAGSEAVLYNNVQEVFINSFLNDDCSEYKKYSIDGHDVWIMTMKEYVKRVNSHQQLLPAGVKNMRFISFSLEIKKVITTY